MQPITVLHESAPRIYKLEALLDSLQKQNGFENYKKAFQILDPQDRQRIVSEILGPTDSRDISLLIEADTRGIHARTKRIVETIIREIRFSFPVNPARPAYNLPQHVLYKILEFSGETHPTLSLVNKQFNNGQKELPLFFILSKYVDDPRMAPFIGNLTHEAIQKMDKNGHYNKIVEISETVQRTAKELGIDLSTKSLNPIDLGLIVQEIQKIRDHDLVIFFEHLIEKIPATLTERTQLRALPTDSERVVYIHKWLENHRSFLDKVTVLQINHAGLKSIPPEIKWLTHLHTLSLSENQLRTIPSEIGEFSNLKRLYLHKNQISYLPKAFYKLSKLDTVYLSNNHLQELSDSFHLLSNLQQVELSNNGLFYLPKQWADLKKLYRINVSHNNLYQIPDELCRLSGLGYADFSHNNISELPDDICLPKLIRANLSYNKISKMPRFLDSSIPSHIDLSHNLVKTDL
jgi:hypothetical protein